MHDRVTFLARTGVREPGGGIEVTFAPADPPHEAMGAYRPVRADRTMTADATEIMRRATLRLRQPSLPAGFDQTWRVRVRGVEWGILSALDVSDDHRFVTLTLGAKG